MYLTLILVLILGGCASGKATFIEGGAKSLAVVEVGMTGGRITINGPFKFCSEPAVMNGDREKEVSTSICAGLVGSMNDSDENESEDDQS